MSTANRKWSLVAFKYVIQWLLWTVILPNKHLTLVCARTESGSSYGEKGRYMLPCKMAMKEKEAGGEQLWSKMCSRPPDSLHQICLDPRLDSVHIHHLVSVLLYAIFGTEPTFQSRCYFTWPRHCHLFSSLLMWPPIALFVVAMCWPVILGKRALVNILTYSMQLRRS